MLMANIMLKVSRAMPLANANAPSDMGKVFEIFILPTANPQQCRTIQERVWVYKVVLGLFGRGVFKTNECAQTMSRNQSTSLMARHQPSKTQKTGCDFSQSFLQSGDVSRVIPIQISCMLCLNSFRSTLVLTIALRRLAEKFPRDFSIRLARIVLLG